MSFEERTDLSLSVDFMGAEGLSMCFKCRLGLVKCNIHVVVDCLMSCSCILCD